MLWNVRLKVLNSLQLFIKLFISYILLVVGNNQGPSYQYTSTVTATETNAQQDNNLFNMNGNGI